MFVKENSNRKKNYAITDSTGAGTFAITDTKLVPVVTLSTLDNTKLLEQLKLGFKRTINWDKYDSELKNYELQNRYLNRLIDPSFQGVNRLSVLLFENQVGSTEHKEYYLPKAEIKEYNVTIDGRNLFDQPVKNDIRTYESIRKIASGQGDDNASGGCLLDYPYFKENYKLFTIDLIKQHALDADSKAIQQINFTESLELAGGATIFFIIEEVKISLFFRFFPRNCKSIVNGFYIFCLVSV